MRLNLKGRSVMPRGVCPSCGKRGLGNVRRGKHSWDSDMRDCRYCGEVVVVRCGNPEDVALGVHLKGIVK